MSARISVWSHHTKQQHIKVAGHIIQYNFKKWQVKSYNTRTRKSDRLHQTVQHNTTKWRLHLTIQQKEKEAGHNKKIWLVTSYNTTTRKNGSSHHTIQHYNFKKWLVKSYNTRTRKSGRLHQQYNNTTKWQVTSYKTTKRKRGRSLHNTKSGRPNHTTPQHEK